MNLAGRTAIVTGAGNERGIGGVTAILLAQRGANVVVADLDMSGARNVAAVISRNGGSAVPVEVDIGDETAIAAMVAKSIDAFKAVEILVNSAADLSSSLRHRDNDVETMAADVWDRTFMINARGTMLACKHVLPSMVQNRSGSIVNITSTTALRGQLQSAAYSSSKAALIQMTRSIAASHGKKGIRCNSVAPSLTVTETMLQFIPAAERQIMESETLLPSLGTPEQIAQVVAFLASSEASHITGQTIVTDGGVTAAGGIGQMRAMLAAKNSGDPS